MPSTNYRQKIKIKKGTFHVGHFAEKQNACWVFGESLKERGNLEDPCTDGRTRLNTHLTKAGCESVDLIDLTGNRDKCQAAVDTVMSFRLPCDAGNCLTS
jgi:hypothetical protein